MCKVSNTTFTQNSREGRELSKFPLRLLTFKRGFHCSSKVRCCFKIAQTDSLLWHP